MTYLVETTKDRERDTWHLHLHDGSGRPEGRFYLCSALTPTEAAIIELRCSGVEAADAHEAYRKMIARLDEVGFESLDVPRV